MQQSRAQVTVIFDLFREIMPNRLSKTPILRSRPEAGRPKIIDMLLIKAIKGKTFLPVTKFLY